MSIGVTSVTPVAGYYYLLEPGDATRYTFYLLDAASKDYRELVIDMGRSSLAYPIGLFSLRNPDWHEMAYLSDKFPNADRYTIMAVLLACAILVDEPDNLTKAAENMLHTRVIMAEYYRAMEPDAEEEDWDEEEEEDLDDEYDSEHGWE